MKVNGMVNSAESSCLELGLIKAKAGQGGHGTSKPEPAVILQLANWPYDRCCKHQKLKHDLIINLQLAKIPLLK